MDLGGVRGEDMGFRRPDAQYIYANLSRGAGADALADAEHVPFREGVFDSLLCAETLEHLQDPYRCLDEIWRVLKPGGTCVITMPFMYRHHRNPSDFQRWTHEKFILELGVKREFKVMAIVPRGGWLTCVANDLILGATGIDQTGNVPAFLFRVMLRGTGFVLSKCSYLLFRLDDWLCNEDNFKGILYRWTTGFVVVAEKIESRLGGSYENDYRDFLRYRSHAAPGGI